MSADRGPKRQDYQTPKKLVRDLALRWAGAPDWDLDVAADNDGGNAVAQKWRGPQHSGLEGPWDWGLVRSPTGLTFHTSIQNAAVWCNPPYESIAPWVELAEQEVEQQRVRVACLLIPERPDTAWYQRIVDTPKLWTIDRIRGRVAFVNPQTQAFDKSPREAIMAAVCRLPLAARDYR